MRAHELCDRVAFLELEWTVFSTAVWEMHVMKPPVPRAWFGLAFFFGVAATFVIARTLDSWTALVPVSKSVPLGTQRALLTLELMLFAVAVQAIWWVRKRLRTRGKTHAHQV